MERDKDCPYCGKSFCLLQECCEHMGGEHAAEFPKPAGWQGLRHDYVVCWCGLVHRWLAAPSEAQSAWANHLAFHLGATSHYLAVQLLGPVQALAITNLGGNCRE